MNVKRALSRLKSERSCRSKHRHASAGAAEAHVRALLKKDGDTKAKAYFCAFCKGYHVGHL